VLGLREIMLWGLESISYGRSWRIGKIRNRLTDYLSVGLCELSDSYSVLSGSGTLLLQGVCVPVVGSTREVDGWEFGYCYQDIFMHANTDRT
jgi:hypothetical protein